MAGELVPASDSQSGMQWIVDWDCLRGSHSFSQTAIEKVVARSYWPFVNG